MTIGSATMTIKDFGMGSLAATQGLQPAVIAPAVAGATNTPVLIQRTEDLVSRHTAGQLVEYAAYLQNEGQKPVVCVRCACTNTGSYNPIDVTGVTGTATIAVGASTYPIDEYDVKCVCVDGGTTGTTGITYKYSLDGGNTYSGAVALSTALSTSIYTTAGETSQFAAKFTFDNAHTLVAGDTWSVRTKAPYPTDAELAAALEALRLSDMPWDFACVAPNSAAQVRDDYDVVSDWCNDLWDAGRYKFGVMSAERPAVGASDTTYQTALSAYTEGERNVVWGAGYVDLPSAISSRRYARPYAWALSARLCDARIHAPRDGFAERRWGALGKAKVTDANGNLVHHDEAQQAGLAALGFACARTWPDKRGYVYPSNPQMLRTAKTSVGTDYQQIEDLLALYLCASTAYPILLDLLEKTATLDSETGYLRAQDADMLDAVITGELRRVCMAAPDVSDVYWLTLRNDPLFASTGKLQGKIRFLPRRRITYVEATIGASNPAVRGVVV